MRRRQTDGGDTAPSPVKSNYLRRRRTSQAARDVERGANGAGPQDSERRVAPNEVPGPRKRA
jgi:hypothetical protein